MPPHEIQGIHVVIVDMKSNLEKVTTSIDLLSGEGAIESFRPLVHLAGLLLGPLSWAAFLAFVAAGDL